MEKLCYSNHYYEFQKYSFITELPPNSMNDSLLLHKGTSIHLDFS